MVRVLIKDFARWVHWYPFRFIAKAVPLTLLRRLVDLTSRLFYLMAAGKRRALFAELRVLDPNFTQNWPAGSVVQRSLAMFLHNELEVLLFPNINKANVADFIECTGLHHLDEALAKGKGVVLIFAHFGANQMIMPALGYRGYIINQLSAAPFLWKLAPSPMLRRASEIRQRHLSSLPAHHIEVTGSLRQTYACLKKNEVLCVAVDGLMGKNTKTMPFLHSEITLATGGLRIAKRSGSPVLPVFVIREPNGRNRLVIAPPLIDDPVGSVESLTELFKALLEQYVLRFPEHYLYFLMIRRKMSSSEPQSLLDPLAKNEATSE